MSRIIRMPNATDLPEGSAREFVGELFDAYRLAYRPSLRAICEAMRAKGDELELAGTASRETVRRMLVGESVPTNWHNVYAVFAVLCDMAGVDPDEEPDDRWSTTRTERLWRAWNGALDGEDAPPTPPRPVPRPSSQPAVDRWTQPVGPNNYTEEPPF